MLSRPRTCQQRKGTRLLSRFLRLQDAVVVESVTRWIFSVGYFEIVHFKISFSS